MEFHFFISLKNNNKMGISDVSLVAVASVLPNILVIGLIISILWWQYNHRNESFEPCEYDAFGQLICGDQLQTSGYYWSMKDPFPLAPAYRDIPMFPKPNADWRIWQQVG